MKKDMKPEWMLDSNGVWTYEVNQMPDIIAEFIQNWLEDNISEGLYEEGLQTASKFKNKEEFDSSVIATFNSYLEVRKESFVSQIDKLKVVEEN